jgi:hypothetical protein
MENQNPFLVLHQELLMQRQLIEKLMAHALTPQAPSVQGPIWFDIHELSRYLPTKPKTATIYNLVSTKRIPYVKNGKNLIFLKEDIDNWLNSGRKATKEQEREALRIDAENHLKSLTKK